VVNRIVTAGGLCDAVGAGGEAGTEGGRHNGGSGPALTSRGRDVAAGQMKVRAFRGTRGLNPWPGPGTPMACGGGGMARLVREGIPAGSGCETDSRGSGGKEDAADTAVAHGGVPGRHGRRRGARVGAVAASVSKSLAVEGGSWRPWHPTGGDRAHGAADGKAVETASWRGEESVGGQPALRGWPICPAAPGEAAEAARGEVANDSGKGAGAGSKGTDRG